MIRKLKEIFPSLVEASIDYTVDNDNYKWFTTPHNKIVGISKKELSNKETKLLETFLIPYRTNQPTLSTREQQWFNVLFKGESIEENKLDTIQSYRFVYFSLSDETIDSVAFHEAIHGLFPIQVPILWENNHEGIIIEENLENDEAISYNEIIEVLMSDFYMNVHLFVSPYFHEFNRAVEQYQWTKYSFLTVHKYNKNEVIDYVDAVPYLLLEPIDEESSSIIVPSILQSTEEDEELLKTIQIFLECNSNATLAAKQLYMHRNSLQYRVDKFIEKTGIDVKQFKGALTVYLTLLLRGKL